MTAFDKHITHSNDDSVGPRDASEQTCLIPIVKAAQGCGIFLDVQSTIAGRAVRVRVDGANWYVTHSAEPPGWVAMPEIDSDRYTGPNLEVRYEMAREPREQSVPTHRWGEFLAGH